MKARWKFISGVGFALIFLLLFMPEILVLPVTLLSGWWPAGARLLPRVHELGMNLVWFFLGFVLLILFCQLFLRWLCGALKTGKEEKIEIHNWRFQWTMLGLGISGCSVLAIVSIVLVTHQLYWLSKGNDHWFENPYQESTITKVAANSLDINGRACAWNAQALATMFWNGGWKFENEPIWEQVKPIWITNGTSNLQAILLIPRQPRSVNSKWGLVIPGTNVTFRRMDELPSVLASYGILRPSNTLGGRINLLP
jgi:hypothetical protein